MAKRTSKSAQSQQSPVPSVAPSPSQEGVASVGKTVDDVLGEITKVQAQRVELAGLQAVVEKQKAKLREAEAAYQEAASAVDQLQAELIAKYPAAAGIFGGAKATKRRGAKRGARSNAPKKAGPVLDQAQAEQVLAALPATFQLAEFKTKTAELFPDRISKGAMELLADKVKDAGGKGMGRRYKKA